VRTALARCKSVEDVPSSYLCCAGARKDIVDLAGSIWEVRIDTEPLVCTEKCGGCGAVREGVRKLLLTDGRVVSTLMVDIDEGGSHED